MQRETVMQRKCLSQKNENENFIINGLEFVDYPLYEDAITIKTGIEIPEETVMPDNGEVRENFGRVEMNSFLKPEDYPTSVFRIYKSRASGSFVKTFLERDRLPPKDSIRLGEMVRYFDFNDNKKPVDNPVDVTVEGAECPWDKTHRLVRVVLSGAKRTPGAKPLSGNIILMLDVGNSMQAGDKLPLVKKSIASLVENLDASQKVTIIAFSDIGAVLFENESCKNKKKIRESIDDLTAGGFSNLEQGMKVAFDSLGKLKEEKIPTRIVLMTDGIFEKGKTSPGDLSRLAEQVAKEESSLTVLGFGGKGYNDQVLRSLALAGRGAYEHIASVKEMKAIAESEFAARSYPVADNVSLKIEFNPVEVAAYRLMGAEESISSWTNQKGNGAVVFAGTRAVSYYEIIPADGKSEEVKEGGSLRFQKVAKPTKEAMSGKMLSIRMKYRNLKSGKNLNTEIDYSGGDKKFSDMSDSFKLGAVVLEFGMLLNDSLFKGEASFTHLLELVRKNAEPWPREIRSNIKGLVERAKKQK